MINNNMVNDYMNEHGDFYLFEGDLYESLDEILDIVRQAMLDDGHLCDEDIEGFLDGAMMDLELLWVDESYYLYGYEVRLLCV